jgi:phospholipase C
MPHLMHAVRRPALAIVGATVAAAALAAVGATPRAVAEPVAETATPISHLVVIFQENVSFDHYFGTYPHAANTDGQSFSATGNTPRLNGLTPALLTDNPNSANPQRLGPAQALTCDQDHGYGDEQAAFDGGTMDRFVETVGNGSAGCDAKQVMDYFDGNTVTALWNYAQRFSMSDNSYGTTFGPSAPGALNLVSGQTHGVTTQFMPGGGAFPAGRVENGSVIGDPQPYGDDCSSRDQVRLSGRNIGDLLNAAEVTWGWFQGGFRPTTTTNGKAVCGSRHPIGAALGYTGQKGLMSDYIPHHEPFQFYASTANPHHLPPSSVEAIGQTDQANHQYDLSDFWSSVDNGTMPAVSFLKAAGYQDGHAGYSDPLDEQQFLVDTLNRLQRTPEWRSTAVVISYDDSDGWYDHQTAPRVNDSTAPADQLDGAGVCSGAGEMLGGYQDRCGYGPRLPLLVLSPYAKRNFVDHTVTDQSSILRFVEDNWLGGTRIGDGSYDERAGSLANLFDFHNADMGRIYLDPATGERR